MLMLSLLAVMAISGVADKQIENSQIEKVATALVNEYGDPELPHIEFKI